MARSAWVGDDRDRPLNKRGRKSARAMGAWLRDRGYLPDLVLCSTAARTRETLEGLGLGEEVPVRYLDALYHAAPETLWDCLAEAEGNTVLMIGHNPGIAAFAADLVAVPPPHARFADFPTGATLVAEVFAANWDAVAPGACTAADFAIPREVMAETGD